MLTLMVALVLSLTKKPKTITIIKVGMGVYIIVHKNKFGTMAMEAQVYYIQNKISSTILIVMTTIKKIA